MFFPKSLIRIERQNKTDEKAIKFIERRRKTLKRYLFTKVVIVFLLTIISISVAKAQEATKVVSNLYKAHKVKTIADWSKAELKKYFTDELADAIYKTAQGESGIGFDILYNTQDDSDITNFKIGDEDSHQESSGQTVFTVTASFKNFGEKKEIFFTLDPDGFKIKDIRYNGLDVSLMEMLTEEDPESDFSAADIQSKTVTDFYLLLPGDSYD